jgi:serine carboxypeptidase-like clade 1
LMDCIILQLSNIIFIDSPIGAGFSYATSEEGLKSSDTMAVKKLVIFLKKVSAFASLTLPCF